MVYTMQKRQSDCRIRGPQKTCYMAYIIHQHDPMGFVVEEAKEAKEVLL